MGQRNPQSEWQSESDQDQEPAIDYRRQWGAYALRRNLALGLLFLWAPVSFGLFYVSRHALHRPITSMAIIAVWLSAALTATWWAGEFRCPRCKRRFGALGHRQGTNLTRGLFDKVCTNCKLRKFEVVR